MLKPITRKAAMMKVRHAMGVMRTAYSLLDEVHDRLKLGTGPEASREEMDPETNGTCDYRVGRVMPAHFLQPQF